MLNVCLIGYALKYDLGMRFLTVKLTNSKPD